MKSVNDLAVALFLAIPLLASVLMLVLAAYDTPASAGRPVAVVVTHGY